MEERRFKVEKEDELIRIDKYINKQVDDLSRSRIQTLIEEGHVFVNGKVTKNNYKRENTEGNESIWKNAEGNYLWDLEPVNVSEGGLVYAEKVDK